MTRTVDSNKLQAPNENGERLQWQTPVLIRLNQALTDAESVTGGTEGIHVPTACGPCIPGSFYLGTYIVS